MSTKYKFLDQEKICFVSFSVINWIDVFTRKEYRDIFLESLKFCQEKKGLEVYAYCIMSNHVHLIISKNDQFELQAIIRDLKKFTSFKITKAIKNNNFESRKEWMLWMFNRAGKSNPNNTNYQFWQQSNHPIELYNNEVLQQKLDYIHNNPP